MKTFIQAIAFVEGFYKLGTRPQRNHNPGDLLYCAESIRFGAIRADGRFAVFPDDKTGWAALRMWLSVPAKFDAHKNLVGGYMGASVAQVITRFAPPFENHTDSYIATVCSLSSLTPSSIVYASIINQ